MTDRPINFSPPMVLALLAGRKTQHRMMAWYWPRRRDGYTKDSYIAKRTPTVWQKVKPGDRLWVRETCRACEQSDMTDGVLYIADNDFHAIENTEAAANRWVDLFHYRKQRGAIVPSIHMPRWASRLTLVVTATRIERIVDISTDDCLAEGAELIGGDDPGWAMDGQETWGSPQTAFAQFWERLHGPGSWDNNPEVVVLSFDVHKRNIDAALGSKRTWDSAGTAGITRVRSGNDRCCCRTCEAPGRDHGRDRANPRTAPQDAGRSGKPGRDAPTI